MFADWSMSHAKRMAVNKFRLRSLALFVKEGQLGLGTRMITRHGILLIMKCKSAKELNEEP